MFQEICQTKPMCVSLVDEFQSGKPIMLYRRLEVFRINIVLNLSIHLLGIWQIVTNNLELIQNRTIGGGTI